VNIYNSFIIPSAFSPSSYMGVSSFTSLNSTVEGSTPTKCKNVTCCGEN